MGAVSLLESGEYRYIKAMNNSACRTATRETTTRSAKLEIVTAFPLFARAGERTSTKLHSIESVVVTGPSLMLFASLYVCTFQPGKFSSLGSLSLIHI